MSRRRGLPPTFVDVLFCVLIFFVVATVLLVTGATDPDMAKELVLPPLNLAQMLANGLDRPGGIGPSVLVVSLSRVGDRVQLSIADEPVTAEEFERRLRTEVPQEVCLRVDEAVTHGEEMKVINIARKSGVSSISFAFEPE